MLPDGKIFGRSIRPDMSFAPLTLTAIAGANLNFWFDADTHGTTAHAYSEADLKNAQAFGEGTVNLLRHLSIAIVGCSGTGSPVIEQLARLGIGRLVLVDPDVVEDKNLNRIPNSTLDDAQEKRQKVDVLARAIGLMGFNTEVVPIRHNLIDPMVLRMVAECDIVFGCMDGHEGRYFLNKLAAFYLLPYIDIGVRLDADGKGGIDRICGSIHFLQPDRSSLLSRRAINLERVRSEGLRRTNPDAYAEQLRAKYILGAQEERPAVISVNMLAASLAVNELLARLHQYRYDDNDNYARFCFELANGIWKRETEESLPRCDVFARHAGRGDVTPLLDDPNLDAVTAGCCHMKYLRRIFTTLLRALGWQIYIASHVADVPDAPESRIVYLVGEGRHIWYIAMRCPCGCGDLLQMNTTAGARPQWSVTEHNDGTVTIHPSVWRKVGCQSHFIIRNGRVIWCTMYATVGVSA